MDLSANNIQVWIAIASIVIIALFAIIWRRLRSDPMKKYLTPNPPKDTVILHQYGKGYTVPSISPFVMKLETYLRVAKIPYVNKYSRKPGPKGKLPWIQYNDRIVPDSQFCIEFLNMEQKIDLNKKLKSDQVAIGHLIRRTVEESLYWTLLMWRLVFEKNGTIYRKVGVPSFIIWYLRRASKPRLWSHGIGRHSQEEVTQIMEEDLKAISYFLGDKNFLFGNTVQDVTEFDCALFGQLCELAWQMTGSPIEGMIAKKYPNLVRYCERMKTAYWPDWEERLLLSPGKSEPTEKSLSNNDELTKSKPVEVKTSESKPKVITGIPVSKTVVKADSGKPETTVTSFSSPGVKEAIVNPTNGIMTSVSSSTTSSTSTSVVREVHKEVKQNQVVTTRSSSKVSASTILQDKSAILPAP